MFTNAERKRIAEIKRERKEMLARASARPAPPIEQDVALVSHMTGEKVPAWSVYLRLTPAEVAAEDRLVAENNAIVAAARRRDREREAAELAEAEIARVRAAACPHCFATHAGECL